MGDLSIGDVTTPVDAKRTRAHTRDHVTKQYKILLAILRWRCEKSAIMVKSNGRSADFRPILLKSVGSVWRDGLLFEGWLIYRYV